MSRIEPTLSAQAPTGDAQVGRADFQDTFPKDEKASSGSFGKASGMRSAVLGGHSPAPETDREAWDAYIGSNSKSYYLTRFERYAKGEKSIWHWPALFVTWYWMLYRRMWPHAILYLVLPVVTMVPLGLIMEANEDAGAVLYLIFLAAYFLAPPILANGFYWRRSMKIMARLRESTNTRDQYLGALSATGGTSSVALIVVGIFGVLAVIGILAAISLPAYNDYTKRAKTSQIMIHGNEAARSVAEYYKAKNTIATDLNVLGVAPIDMVGVVISISPDDGTVTYTLSNLGTMTFQPTMDKDGKIGVECQSQDIQPKLLPLQCR